MSEKRYYMSEMNQDKLDRLSARIAELEAHARTREQYISEQDIRLTQMEAERDHYRAALQMSKRGDLPLDNARLRARIAELKEKLEESEAARTWQADRIVELEALGK